MKKLFISVATVGLVISNSVFAASSQSAYVCSKNGVVGKGASLEEAYRKLDSQLSFGSSCQSAVLSDSCDAKAKQSLCYLSTSSTVQSSADFHGYFCASKGFLGFGSSKELAYHDMEQQMPEGMSCQSAVDYQGCMARVESESCFLK